MYLVCHFKFTLHIHDLTFISGGGEDGGGVNWKGFEEHDRNCIAVYVSVKPLDIFNQTMAISTGLSKDKTENQTKRKFNLSVD